MVALFLLLLSFIFIDSAYAKRVQIRGEYCYQYGDSESLMVAKEISYAMALRKAIETYKTFISSTSIVKDFKLKKDLIETIASGYVDNVKIIKQDVKGRTVCTTLIGYVNPDAVKSIISRKVERVKKTRTREFKGLISNECIKILNYKREGQHLSILYQAKKRFNYTFVRIVIDCFDRNGNPIEGRSSDTASRLDRGEVRKEVVELPGGTASFEIRLGRCP
ncbi:MAG: hypothetical protein Q7J27_01755 [Syntrophales bacterium]|nr:hypothetical protein [Syntrophales bacterium]